MQREERATRKSGLAAKYISRLVFALTLASFYLIGDAFRQGYLARLHLEPSMFPVDVPTTYVKGVLAVGYGLVWLLTAIPETLYAHWLRFIFILTYFVLVLGAAYFVIEIGLKKSLFRRPIGWIRWLKLHWLKLLRSRAGRWVLRQFRPFRLRRDSLKPVIRAFLKSIRVVAFSVMVTFASIVGLAMFVVLLIEPFSKTGAHVAEQDAAKGFSDQPVVTLRGPDGKVRDYRVMECNDDYCALFRYGHTFAVQKGEVNWAASPLAVTR